MRMIWRVLLVVGLAAGCGRAADEGAAEASAGGEGTARAAPGDGRVHVAARAPGLSDAVVASDARSPSLLVSVENGWVVVPSFRLGVAMPEGWYWSDVESLIAGSAGAPGVDEAEIAAARRGMQAVANEYESAAGAPASMQSSARVMVVGGTLDPSGTAGLVFCEDVLVAQLRTANPDTALSSFSALTIGGWRSVRCGLDWTMAGAQGPIAAHAVNVMIFGASNTLVFAVVGSADRRAATEDTMNAMVASVQTL